MTGQIAVQPLGQRLAAQVMTLFPVNRAPAGMEQIDKPGVDLDDVSLMGVLEVSRDLKDEGPSVIKAPPRVTNRDRTSN